MLIPKKKKRIFNDSDKVFKESGAFSIGDEAGINKNNRAGKTGSVQSIDSIKGNEALVKGKERINKSPEAFSKSDQEFISLDDSRPLSVFESLGTPSELIKRLNQVGYQCLPYLAIELSLLLNTPTTRIRSLLLEGPSGCGKSFLAKSLAKITGAELITLSCYKGMPTANLIEAPSTLAMAKAYTGSGTNEATSLMNLGIISRVFLTSQEKPIVFLVDELDKPDTSIDTFFLGPIQDARIWLESRSPIDANTHNIIIIFTKNFNRVLDEALLRRCHPIKMTYLDSTLERQILSSFCDPKLIDNLVAIADRMRYSGGSYQFDRPPAPEELLSAGHYVMKLLNWGIQDYATVGKSIWNIVAKSEHDRAVLEHMMRFHPDFHDPLVPDPKNASKEDIYKRFGRYVLNEIVADPDALAREKAWEGEGYN
jgi:hypothetical protein